MEKVGISSFPGRTATQRSFAFQYTALMLIILTFVVGYFVGQQRDALTTALIRNQKIESEMSSSEEIAVVKSVALDKQNFTLHFTPYGELEPTDELLALTSVLTHHDLSITFSFPTSVNEIESDISRFLVLQRYLVENGVPLSVVQATFPLSAQPIRSVSYTLFEEEAHG